MLARIAPGPQVVIGNVGAKVREGVLVDEARQRFGLEALNRLIEIYRCQSAREISRTETCR
jgi:chromate reductase, NAD(P)H dehydrogenase (quinone)